VNDFRVSVVITCYNAVWCIVRALDSVVEQTRPADEIVVTDDGSTDDTVARIEARYGDAVKVVRYPHRGLTPTRRAALDLARGPWFALMDADDIWAPAKLERQVAFLERHPEVRWISTDGRYVSASGVLRDSWLSDYFDPVREMVGDLFPPLLERCFPLLSSSLVHADAYRAVGGFDVSMPFSQDYDLWLRLAARYPAAVLPEPLIDYWSSPGQLSRRIEERDRDDLRLMESIARGELRRDGRLRRAASRRVAALQFDLGVTCLRSGRVREGQLRLWRAATGRGPVRRRALALLGALAPRWSLRRLMRSEWLKDTVRSVKPDPARLTGGAPPEVRT
jgi:hypothetical protein